MGTTPNYSFPYPALGDPPDGASQIQSLASAVDTTLAAQIASLQSQVNGITVPVTVYKAAQLARATTTKSTDPDLQLTLAASSVYEVRASIIYSGTGGLGFTWTIPAGVTGGYTATMSVAGTGEATQGYVWSATVEAGTLTATVLGIQVAGILVTGSSGGTFGFSWADFTASDTLTLGAFSSLTVREL